MGRSVRWRSRPKLVHSASLLHDDVIDGGMFRRARPTVNAVWGNITAVMAGDLFAHHRAARACTARAAGDRSTPWRRWRR